METFAEISYQGIDMEMARKEMELYIGQLKLAKSYEEMKQLFLEQRKKSNRQNTIETIAHIRNTIDTNDEFYQKEMAYFFP